MCVLFFCFFLIVNYELIMSLAVCDLSIYLFILQEEQDIKALQVKNRKLGEALDQRQVHASICVLYTQM